MLDHLRVVDEADELPIAQVNDSLWHVLRHVDDRDFFILWRERLVGEQWVVHNPGLLHRFLEVAQLFIQFVLFLLLSCTEHVQLVLVATIFFVDHRPVDLTGRADNRRADVNQLHITVLLGPQEGLVEEEAEVDAVLRLPCQSKLLLVLLFLLVRGDTVKDRTCLCDSLTITVDVFIFKCCQFGLDVRLSFDLKELNVFFEDRVNQNGLVNRFDSFDLKLALAILKLGDLLVNKVELNPLVVFSILHLDGHLSDEV